MEALKEESNPNDMRAEASRDKADPKDARVEAQRCKSDPMDMRVEAQRCKSDPVICAWKRGGTRLIPRYAPGSAEVQERSHGYAHGSAEAQETDPRDMRAEAPKSKAENQDTKRATGAIDRSCQASRLAPLGLLGYRLL